MHPQTAVPRLWHTSTYTYGATALDRRRYG